MSFVDPFLFTPLVSAASGVVFVNGVLAEHFLRENVHVDNVIQAALGNLLCR